MILNKNFTILLIFIGFLLFTSCEKEVKFNLPPAVSEKMVVEGSIEKNGFPIVLITKSFGFFYKVDLSKLESSFIHGAVVEVSNNNKTVLLKEYTIDTLGNNFSFYTIDTANPSQLIIGEENMNYQLKITYDGKEYISTTNIPSVAPLDSIWSEALAEPIEGNDNYRKVFVRYTDPDTLGNRIRIYTRRNNAGYLTGRFSVNDDAIINGTTLDVEISNGIIPMDTANMETYRYFEKGDTVTVKWSAIDKATFDFWQTLEFSVGTNGNPFSTPLKVGSNISNGALGIWAGYNPTYATLIIEN